VKPTRALGALLIVGGLAWFLAVPAILPAAYHGYVHTGHEHAQFAAPSVDPGGQSTADLLASSQHAATHSPDREWTAVRASALEEADRRVLRAAASGDANATDDATRERYRRLEAAHRYVSTPDGWVALDLVDAANYTTLTARRTDTPTVVRAIAVEPSAFPGAADEQATALVRAEGALLVSAPALPTPLYLAHDDRIHRVGHLGNAPTPPSLPALVLFLVPGVVLALLGVFLAGRH
jgi:hypothetical protein